MISNEYNLEKFIKFINYKLTAPYFNVYKWRFSQSNLFKIK